MTRCSAAWFALMALPALVGTACFDGDAPCHGDACAVLPAFPTGGLANDVVLSTCDGRSVALVAASAEGRLMTHLIPGGEVLASAFFPNDVDPDTAEERGASPWAVDVTADGTRAVVSLFGQDAVALIAPCVGQVLDVQTVAGQTTPQPVVVSDHRAFVGFTNIEAFSLDGEPPVLGPGGLAVFTFDGDALLEEEVRVLPGCVNPQGLVAHEGDVIVSCSGPLAQGGDGGQHAVGDGALLVGDHVIDAGRAAPATPAVIHGFIVVGSLVDPVILVAALTDDVAREGARLPGPSVDAVFETVAWSEDTALALQFSADDLHVLHVGGNGEVLLEKTLAVGPGGTAFRGAQAIDVDADAADGEIDALVLLGLSAEIVPLRLHGVAQ
jgi:hypothetical protein